MYTVFSTHRLSLTNEINKLTSLELFMFLISLPQGSHSYSKFCSKFNDDVF